MKRMKKWKNLAALCVVICLILSLTACGGSQKAPESGTSVEKDSQTSSGQESVPVEAATQDEAADVTAAETAAADVTAAETAAADATAAEIAEPSAVPDYAKEENWAYFGLGEDKDADLFLICPTVDTRDEYNMSMDDEEVKQSFSGALNMERGIYEDNTRMFAPYYRQAAMKIYNLSPEEREPYLELAYQDVSAAFSWYLENKNEGRPIVLAGFSQGADMCYRILKEYFGDSALQQQLVAVYSIGWPMTEQMITEYPQIRPAASENDTGVVVSPQLGDRQYPCRQVPEYRSLLYQLQRQDQTGSARSLRLLHRSRERGPEGYGCYARGISARSFLPARRFLSSL